MIKGKTSVIVKVFQTENIHSLIKEFKEIDKVNKNARIYPAHNFDPVVVFKGVSTDLKNEELSSSICEMSDRKTLL